MTGYSKAIRQEVPFYKVMRRKLYNPVCGPRASFPCTLHERIKNSCSELQGRES
jgi:hypothetical protein